MNPTPEEIKAYCANLEKSLLKAQESGVEVCFTSKHFNKPAYDHEHYGATPVDLTYTGLRITIEIGEPARRHRLDDEAARRRRERQR